jgi:sterol-4alpha-carboxylate 3-dehydrogenase (decarboxylating)
MSPKQKDIYLVIGGSGFVGRHIVQALLDRGDSVSVFDIVQRYHDVPFYSGDISEEGSVAQALQKVCIDITFVCLLCLIFWGV